MAVFSNARCLAATLPPELLQIIFSLAVKMELAERPRAKQHTREFALVCKGWRSIAQRILYAKGFLIRFKEWDHCLNIARANSELASYVRSLKITVWLSKEDSWKWAAQDLSTLLKLLPSLNTVTLALRDNTAGPGYKGDFSALVTLPTLQDLTIRSDRFDKDLKSCRQILERTPNLTTLSMLNDYSGVHSLPTRKKIVPVTLPRLNRLSLSGHQLVHMFSKLQLLDNDTLKNLTDLSLLDGRSPTPRIDKYNATDLLAHIGPQLRRLEVSKDEAFGLEPAKLVGYCPNLVTLIASIAELGPFPSTLRTLDLDVYGHYYDTRSFTKLLSTHSTRFEQLDILKVYSFGEGLLVPGEEIKRACLALGVRLFVNGAFEHLSGEKTMYQLCFIDGLLSCCRDRGGHAGCGGHLSGGD